MSVGADTFWLCSLGYPPSQQGHARTVHQYLCHPDEQKPTYQLFGPMFVVRSIIALGIIKTAIIVFEHSRLQRHRLEDYD